jgi:3-deoxy-D-manno-octulosonate 8-phosphate phosphatase (KDO 8-P phosphatase)
MRNKIAIEKFNYAIFDVDGVMTSGNFIYSDKGKVYKVFGPDDSDALNILSAFLNIIFVSADKRGFKITKKRIVDDMGFELHNIGTFERLGWLKKKFDLKKCIYMGDGIFDHIIMKEVGYSIAPINADERAKKFANYVTKCRGGERAVSEACIHLLNNFFDFNNDFQSYIKNK